MKVVFLCQVQMDYNLSQIPYAAKYFGLISRFNRQVQWHIKQKSMKYMSSKHILLGFIYNRFDFSGSAIFICAEIEIGEPSLNFGVVICALMLSLFQLRLKQQGKWGPSSRAWKPVYLKKNLPNGGEADGKKNSTVFTKYSCQFLSIRRRR